MNSATSLRIYVNSTDQFKGLSVYEAIVERARKHELAGVTVTRGIMGFGERKELHRLKNLSLIDNLPVVIEITDDVDKIENFLSELDGLLDTGLVVLEPVEAVRHDVVSGEGHMRAS